MSFFYAPLPPDGTSSHPVRVLHLTDLAGLVRRHAPAGVRPIPAYEMRLREERMFPGVESRIFYEAFAPDERVASFYRGLQEGDVKDEPIPYGPLARFVSSVSDVFDPERPMHRVLGYAASIQGDPYIDAEVDLTRRGWEGWDNGSEEAARIRKSARRWRLLLQVDADGEDETLLNQDGGFFYFWITEDALARHDFAEARGTLQCH